MTGLTQTGGVLTLRDGWERGGAGSFSTMNFRSTGEASLGLNDRGGAEFVSPVGGGAIVPRNEQQLDLSLREGQTVGLKRNRFDPQLVFSRGF